MKNIDKALRVAIEIRAVQLANKFKSSEIGVGHVLYAIIDDKGKNAVQAIFNDLNIDTDDLLSDLKAYFKKKQQVDVKNIQRADELEEIYNYCKQNYISRTDEGEPLKNFVSTSDFLLALVARQNSISHILKHNGFINNIQRHIIESIYTIEPYPNNTQTIMSGIGESMDFEFVINDSYDYDPFSEEDTHTTEKKTKSNAGDIPYSKNLVDYYKKKSTSNPCYGRDDEIDKTLRTLLRLKKRNVILLGEAGVGKTSVVEGLAYKIAKNDVPEEFLNKKIYQLNVNEMLSGTKYRGMFEKNLESFIEKIKKDKNAIIFIDEIHNIVGLGSIEDSNDMANILKPHLSNGDISVIGTTTHSEYNRKIKGDKALSRRFKNITIGKLDFKTNVEILNKVKSVYVKTHGVTISKRMIKNIVELTEKYIPNKNVLDKGVDIIDDACVIAKSNTESYVSKFTEQIKAVKQKINLSVKSRDYSKAKDLKDQLEILNNKTEKSHSKSRVSLKTSDVITAIEEYANIPIEKHLNIKSKFENIKKEILQRDEVLAEIEGAIIVNSLEVDDSQKPIGSFLFVGASGVGKTEVAKQLAMEFFGSKHNVTKIDCSEYSSSADITRLIGASAGYIGYENDGVLSSAIDSNPFRVILFDEIEKAHKSIYNLLLQLLDEGVVTNNKGDKVSFKNTIVILTSNIGLNKLKSKSIGFGDRHNSDVKAEILNEIHHFFNTEFLNRLDETIYFTPLKEESIKSLLRKDLERIKLKLKQKRVTFTYNDNLIEGIFKFQEYDPLKGYRPFKRIINKQVLLKIAKQIQLGNKNVTVKI